MSSSTGSSSRSPHSEFSSASPASDPSSLSSTADFLHDRKCKTLGSSVDDWVTSYGRFINEDLRVGGPILCAIPARTTPLPQTSAELVRLAHLERTTLMDDFKHILHRHKVSWTELGMDGRQSVFDPEPAPIPTVFVLANRQPSASDWLGAVKDMHRSLLEQGFQNVQVEIADPEALQLPTCSLALETDSIFPLWGEVCGRILRSSSLQEWNALECLRYGKHDDVSLNPPTVVVSVSPNSKHNWTPVRNSILQILFEFKLWDVGVAIVPDKIIRAYDFFNAKSHCREKAQAGLSVGLNNLWNGSGTLGGFLELKFDTEDTWRKFGVTCFHVAYAPTWLAKHEHIYLSRKWCGSPVLPGDPAAARALQMTQPGLFDLVNAVKALDKNMATAQSPDFHRIKAAVLADDFVIPSDKRFYDRVCDRLQSLSEDKGFIESFIAENKMYLGHVFSGSGLQRVKSVGPDPHAAKRSAILDWALIQVVPERDTDDSSISPYGPSSYNPFAPGYPICEMYTGNPSNCDNLYKASRSTEYTEGTYSGLKSVHITRAIVDGKEVAIGTEEHAAYISGSKGFSQNGDSGSFVVDNKGKVVGLLFAGSERKRQSYFTHIVDLVNDIKEVTGAVFVRLMGSDMAL